MPRTRYTWRRHREAQGRAVANCTPSSWDNGEFNPISSGQLPGESNFDQCIPFIGEMDVSQIQAMVKLACCWYHLVHLYGLLIGGFIRCSIGVEGRGS